MLFTQDQQKFNATLTPSTRLVSTYKLLIALITYLEQPVFSVMFKSVVLFTLSNAVSKFIKHTCVSLLNSLSFSITCSVNTLQQFRQLDFFSVLNIDITLTFSSRPALYFFSNTFWMYVMQLTREDRRLVSGALKLEQFG